MAALVERHKDQPFLFLGVNSDRDPDRYRELVERMGVNWRSTFEGAPDGPWPARWGVTSWPTIYVLDHRGVIRFEGVRGEELDRAVEELLANLQGSPDAGGGAR